MLPLGLYTGLAVPPYSGGRLSRDTNSWRRGRDSAGLSICECRDCGVGIMRGREGGRKVRECERVRGRDSAGLSI